MAGDGGAVDVGGSLTDDFKHDVSAMVLDDRTSIVYVAGRSGSAGHVRHLGSPTSRGAGQGVAAIGKPSHSRRCQRRAWRSLCTLTNVKQNVILLEAIRQHGKRLYGRRT